MRSPLRPWLVLTLLSLGLAARVRSADTSSPTFEYDHGSPLDVKEVGQVKKFEALVRDVTFDGGSGTVRAYVVAPAAGGTGLAGILYVHWLGEPATTNRTEFLNEAIALCGQGVVSVCVDTMWAQPKWYEQRTPENDYADSVRQVIALRRALDLLLAQPGVDPKRLAFVGHDIGAMYGCVMGAVDGRPRFYVLMAPTPRMSDWYLFNVKPASLDDYKKELTPLDPLAAVPRLAPAPVFYQFAAKDKYVPKPRPTEFYDATAPRKLMATYDCTHDLLLPEVATDRIAWLERELGLK